MKLVWAFLIGAGLILGGALTIGGAEVIALLNATPGDTASEHVWGLSWPWVLAISLFCVALSVFFYWLAQHFAGRYVRQWIEAYRHAYYVNTERPTVEGIVPLDMQLGGEKEKLWNQYEKDVEDTP